MEDLAFIKNIQLRERVENAIEYVYALSERSKREDQNGRYQEETHRVIILYVVSTIEAILLYLYKERGEAITSVEYKFVQPLPAEYKHSTRSTSPVVIAVQEYVAKKEHQIGLHDLVSFFKEKELMQETTAESILEINDVRNTFHLSKERSVSCDITQVEKAFSLLVHTIERAPRALRKK